MTTSDDLGAASDDLGRFQSRRRRVLAALVVAIFFVLLFVGSATSPDAITHEYIEWAGGVLIFVAILGRMWCTLYIGGRKSSEIVAGGPYSITRNPLYLFSAVGAAGVGAMTGSVTVAVAFGISTWLAFLTVILVEERFLEQSFGEPYRAYMRKVPRFFPKPWLFRESEALTVRPQLLYKTLSDGLVFVLAYPFFEMVEKLQDNGTLPVLLRLY